MSAKQRTIWTFAITSAAVFMATLDNLVVTTALPVIRKDLHASIESLEWTVNAYTLTFAVLLLTGAALGDRFGRRRMLAVGLGIFTVSSAAAALAPTAGALIAARAAQGVGGAIVTPLTLTILSAGVPANRRGAFIGAWSGIAGLAVAFGPLVGGAVVSGISWHWIFWLNVPIGVALIPLALARLDESYGPSNKLDLPGVALASGGLFGIVWGLVRGNAQGWSSPEIVGRSRWAPSCSRCSSLGAARGGADAADALLPQPRLHARERRVAADVLRDVRLDLPAVAVLPDRAGLLAARLRPADPAVDDHADVRRADRRALSRPRRCARLMGDRPDAQARARVDRAISTPTTPYCSSSRRSWSRGNRQAMFWAAGRERRGRRRAQGREEGQAAGAQNADPRARAASSGVAVLASYLVARTGSYAERH
jgi:hypothetical protein